MEIEFFAVKDVITQMEADLHIAAHGARLKLLTALAWQIRQRDSKRAAAMVQEAQALLMAAAHQPICPPHLQHTIELRLMLVQAEEKWLLSEFAVGTALAEKALQGFIALTDATGCADAHWIMAWLAYDQGKGTQTHAQLEAMIQAASGIDPVRTTVAQAALARLEAFNDIPKAKKRWSTYIDSADAIAGSSHPAAMCWIEDFWGTVADLSGDYVLSIRHKNNTYAMAMATGQQRRAMTAAYNINETFKHLNEYSNALEWTERLLDLARESGWPGMVGGALMQSAETLRRLERFDAAAETQREALALMAPLSGSRNYAMALQHLGDVELERKQYASALAIFRSIGERAATLGQTDMIPRALRGQAEALCQLGEPEQALQTAQAALASAQSDVLRQISALRIIASIHSQYALPGPQAMCAGNAQLHYLQQALDLAADIPDYTIPADLLEAAADEYAHIGEHIRAFQLAKQAISARKKTHSRDALNRSQAMQITFQTERAEIEAAHLRELASEAKRAEILQQTSETLERLSAIGQEITAHLEADRIFLVLQRHAHHLLDTGTLAIYLMNEAGNALQRSFGVDNDALMPKVQLSLDDPAADIVRCVRERREILIDQSPALDDPRWLLPTPPALSRLYAPLCQSEKILGAMTIQSRKRHAFGNREQLIFRTLCAYTAIALSNADAHGKLAAAHRLQQETQQQMVLQGKMAGLGTLTAGVAHEINNPTNFVHVAAQNQRADINEFVQFVAGLLDDEAEPAILQAFNQRFERLADNVATMLNGTERIKGIVKDLRAFTRLDPSEKKAIRMSECLHSTLNLVRTSWVEKVEFITEFTHDPEIECWPALLNQVFMNLLVNGCQAIDEKQQKTQNAERGKLWLRLNIDQENRMLAIGFQDTGVGISKAAQARIMEPFYTTKAIGVGTGLGLSIAFGIAQKHGGDLHFTSTPGVGSCFTINLPLLS